MTVAAQPRRPPLLLAAAAMLALLPLLLFWPFANAPFVSDDFHFCTAQIPVKEMFVTTWPNPIGRTAAYRPLALLSYAVDRQWSGTTPTGFHLTNYFLHGLASALLLLLTWELTRSRAVAVASGLLFCVHPVHHENIFWISGRTFPLAAVFYLAALLAGIRAAESGARRIYTVCVVALSFGAAASYEGAFSLPLAAAALGMALPGNGRWRRAWSISWPALLAVGICVALRWSIASTASADFGQWSGLQATMPAGARINFLRSLTSAAHLAVGLTQYRFHATLPQWLVPMFSIGVLVIVAGMLRSPRLRPAIAFGVGLIWIGFLPFAFVESYSDRFSYLASAGYTLATAGGIVSIFGGRGRKAWLAALLCFTVLAAGSLRQTYVVAREWRAAGYLGQSMMLDLVKAFPSPPSGAVIHLSGWPATKGSAWVFRTYLYRAVQLAYGRTDFEIVEQPSLQSLRSRLAPSDSTFFFHWNGSRWRRIVPDGATAGQSTIDELPSAGSAESGIRMSLDLPRAGDTLTGAITVAGWAFDPQALTCCGIEAVQVWAQRVDSATAERRSLGIASVGGWRPDVARVYGETFGPAAFSLTTHALTPGQYDIIVAVRSERTERWEDRRTVRVIVR